MYSIENFRDLQCEIEISKIRIEGLEKQKELLLKLLNRPPAGYKEIDYSGMPKGSQVNMSLDRIVEHIGKLDSMLYIESETLHCMIETTQRIESKLKDLKGMKYQIGYKRIIENKTYKEIAQELHMNESYVRRIGAEIEKEKH